MTRPRQLGGFVVEPDLLDGLSTLALTRDLAPVVLAERNYDVLSHHRSGVLKDAKSNFDRGRGAQKFLGSKLGRFGRLTGKGRLPTKVSQVRGESFAASEDEILEGLERGGSQNTAEPMAIPVAPRFRRNPKRFAQLMERRQFVVVGARGLLIDPDDKGQDERTEIAGVLTKRIVRRPRLGFMDRWDQIRPKAEAKFAADLDKLVTEAGRKELRSRIRARKAVVALSPRATKAALEAGEREYQRFITANPGDVPGARAAKRRVVRSVRSDLLDRVRADAEGLA